MKTNPQFWKLSVVWGARFSALCPCPVVMALIQRSFASTKTNYAVSSVVGVAEGLAVLDDKTAPQAARYSASSPGHTRHLQRMSLDTCACTGRRGGLEQASIIGWVGYGERKTFLQVILSKVTRAKGRVLSHGVARESPEKFCILGDGLRVCPQLDETKNHF